VNDKFQAAAAYTGEKDPPLTSTKESVWTPEQVWSLWRKEKYISRAEI